MSSNKVEFSFKIKKSVFNGTKEFADIEDISIDDVVELALIKYLDLENDIEEE